MTLRLVLLPFGRVRPDLDALPGEWSPVAGAADGAAHPEAALADPVHDCRALAVVVRPARHRLGRCEAVRAGRQQESGNPACQNPGCQDGAADGEEVAAVEYDHGHVHSSWRPYNGSGKGTTTGTERPVGTKGATGRNNSVVNGGAGRSDSSVGWVERSETHRGLAR